VSREHTPKMPSPDNFDGSDPADLSRFIAQVRMVIDTRSSAFLSDQQKVIWAASHLHGAAFDWWEPHYSLPPNERPVWIYNFEMFRHELKTAFGDPNARLTSKKNLRNL